MWAFLSATGRGVNNGTFLLNILHLFFGVDLKKLYTLTAELVFTLEVQPILEIDTK
jgi:hypothetical protein